MDDSSSNGGSSSTSSGDEDDDRCREFFDAKSFNIVYEFLKLKLADVGYIKEHISMPATDRTTNVCEFAQLINGAIKTSFLAYDESNFKRIRFEDSGDKFVSVVRAIVENTISSGTVNFEMAIRIFVIYTTLCIYCAKYFSKQHIELASLLCMNTMHFIMETIDGGWNAFEEYCKSKCPEAQTEAAK